MLSFPSVLGAGYDAGPTVRMKEKEVRQVSS